MTAKSQLEYLGQKPPKKGLQSMVMLQNERRVNGQLSVETRYYISSLESHAAKVAAAVRTHWSIENSLLGCWMSRLLK